MSKIELKDFVKYGELFDTYGSLLSDDRQKIMTSYFEYNMTLVEIAQERGVSRQAVLDAIDKSCEKLDLFEMKLGVVAKKVDLKNEIEALKSICKDANQTQINQKIEEILRKL